MQEIKEVWKPIKDYEGFYEVSNLGNVRSLPREVKTGIATYLSKIKILKPQLWVNGYQFVCLSKKGIVKQFSIHRLVAIHFVEGYSKILEVNHINEIKTDNNFKNLEWVTKHHNLNHGTRKSRSKNISDNSGKNNPMFGVKYSKNKLSKRVTQLDSLKIKINTFSSVSEAGDILGLKKSLIARASRLGIKTGGFYWEYE